MDTKNLQEIQELKATIEKMSKLINYDTLTNLPNKNLFLNLLKKSIANASRNNYIIAVVILDLNRLNNITKVYTEIKDELILEIVQRLKIRVREGDIIARMEDDKFAIILEHINNESVIPKVINLLLETISSTCRLSNGSQINITPNAGVALAPKDSLSAHKIFQFANDSLKQAKQDGVSPYRFYNEIITQKAIHRLAYEATLQKAVKENKLELYYQPKIDLKSREIVGAEALLRWSCKDYGLVPPNIFIPLANETGLIHPIGDIILEKVSKQLEVFSENGYNTSISINLSTNQILYQNIPELLKKNIEKGTYSAKNLEIELTEDALLKKGADALTMLQEIKSLGVTITLDKFGSGHSSLALLQQFPIDYLKVDKGILKNNSLMSAIIKMSKALGFKVIGQKIEHHADVEFLRDNGCDIYQGFVLSRAVPAMKFEEMLRDQESQKLGDPSNPNPPPKLFEKLGSL